MSKLVISIDNELDIPILGGLVVINKTSDIAIGKVLGMYKNKIEVFNIVTKDVIIVGNDECRPAKITIDGLKVSKESYRIFVTNLDKDYSYTTESYLRNPKVGESVRVIDLNLLESTIFKKDINSNVKVTITEKYNKHHHGYAAVTSNGIEIYVRRAQFVLDNNNYIKLAFLKGINE